MISTLEALKEVERMQTPPLPKGRMRNSNMARSLVFSTTTKTLSMILAILQTPLVSDPYRT